MQSIWKPIWYIGPDFLKESRLNLNVGSYFYFFRKDYSDVKYKKRLDKYFDKRYKYDHCIFIQTGIENQYKFVIPEKNIIVNLLCDQEGVVHEYVTKTKKEEK